MKKRRGKKMFNVHTQNACYWPCWFCGNKDGGDQGGETKLGYWKLIDYHDNPDLEIMNKHVAEAVKAHAYVVELALRDALREGKRSIELPHYRIPGWTIRYHLGGPISRLILRVKLWWRIRKWEAK